MCDGCRLHKIIWLVVVCGALSLCDSKIDDGIDINKEGLERSLLSHKYAGSGFIHGVKYPHRESNKIDTKSTGLSEDILKNELIQAMPSFSILHLPNVIQDDSSRGITFDKKENDGKDIDIGKDKPGTHEMVSGSNVNIEENIGLFGTISYGTSYGVPGTSTLMRAKMRATSTYWTAASNNPGYSNLAPYSDTPYQFWTFNAGTGIIRNIGTDQCLGKNKGDSVTYAFLLTCNRGDLNQYWIWNGDNRVRWMRDSTAALTDGKNHFLTLNDVRTDQSQVIDWESTGVCWVKYTNADRSGGDMVPAIVAASEDDCLQKCSYLSGCVTFTYNTVTKNCFLKNAMNNQIQYPEGTGVVEYDFFCAQRSWPAGQYLNIVTLYLPANCPPGTYCPNAGMTYTITCPVGYYCPNAGGSYAIPCPAGSYCPNAGMVNQILCPAGYYCPYTGMTYTIICPAGSYCPTVGTVNQIQCPAGYYCPQGSATYNICPGGRYCPAGSGNYNLLCTAGYYCPAGSSVSTQYRCGTGFYSYTGAADQTWCGIGTYFPESHWVGGPLKEQCICDIGWTGTNCEIQKCADVLPGVSMLSILFNSDSRLRQYSTGYKDDSAYTFNAKQYMKTLLSVGLDFDGDGNISRTEVTNAIKYRSLWTANMQAMPIWCRTTTPGAHCYQDISSEKVEVSTVYIDAVANFIQSAKHTFDGSGVAILSYINATFPSPSWSIDNCRKYDSSYASYSKVSAVWDFKAVSGQSLDRVCGYMNGAISNAFTTSDVLKGTTKSFTDNVAVSSDASQKRLYCVGIDVVLSTGGKSTSFECAVGLFYDGSPVDLFPTLTTNGVIFEYLDTSSGESEFDIFVGDVGTSDEQKKFVVGINYPATSCGRVTQHISFADKENMKNVGQMMEYGIRAIQSINGGPAVLTRMTTFAYRIPYLTRINGDVTTPSGTGIEGVSVSFCHIDPSTGVDEIDTNFCPLQVLVTDKRGHFEGEIRVSHPKWINQAEYFNATASLVETMEDGTVIVHEFDPPNLVVKTGHTFGFTNVDFTDTTTVTVFGTVIFDPNIVSKNRCPLAGVPVMMIEGTDNNSTVTSGEDGSFEFALTRGQGAYVVVQDFNGYTWASNISSLLTAATQKAGSRRDLIELTETSEFSEWMDGEGEGGVQSVSVGGSSTTASPTPKPTPRPTTNPTPQPTPIPTMKPTQIPTERPSAGPTISPSTSSPTVTPTQRPTVQPTRGPTVKPTPKPTSIPTPKPTKSPTVRPTIHIADGATTQLIHQYSFNKDPPYGGKAHDEIGNSDAILVNGVTITGGKAKFDFQPGIPVPYIQLPYAILGGFQAVTVECWADFEATNDLQATLFSFGANPTSLSIRSAFVGVKSVYIAVVYNPLAGYSKVYVNGALSQTTPMSSNVRLGGSYNLDAFNFIGRNFTSPKTGLDVSIDEFRVWYGELDSKMIQSNYRTGVDPSHVTITSGDSRSNIQITFMATSLQPISIGFYGGEAQFPLFGPETKVQLIPNDTQCKYSPILSLSTETSAITTTIAAMNYTVMLLDSGLPAPTFDASVCDPTHPSITSCFCDVSKPPYQYVVDSGQLNQSLVIPFVDDNIIFINYSYHSGVCFDATGSENFALEEGTAVGDAGCFPSDTLAMAQGDTQKLTVFLFELYPVQGFTWFTGKNPIKSVLVTSVEQASIDFNVTNANIVIRDFVSAKRPQTFPYVLNLSLPNALAQVPVPQGLSYTIKAAGPTFISPFDWEFAIDVFREGPDGESYTTNTWYIPVTGVLTNEVPTFYPVATDPTLIYMVLRDPPGGGSSTTFHAGTNLDFSVSIDNLKTFQALKASEDAGEGGVDVEFQLSEAPFGFGIQEPLLNIAAFGKHNDKRSRSVTATKSSTTNYDISMSFEYDISTSSDPNIAGHASDVIVGGGIDLIVSQAKEVLKDNDTTASQTGFICYKARDTFVWQPGRATTYVFAVYEIEQLIDALSAIVGLGVDATAGRDQATIDSLTNQIQNWQTVLSKYREYNADETAMFSMDTTALLDFMTEFKNHEGHAQKDYQKILNDLLKDKKIAMPYDFDNAHYDVIKKCSSVIPAYRNEHMTNICNNFKSETWSSFLDAIESVCDSTDPDAFKSKFPYLNQLCIERPLDQTVNIPGGYKKMTGSESMFGFLKDKEKYLTFGADAPFTISYTSTITQSMSFVSSMEVSGDVTDDSGGAFEVKIVFARGSGDFTREAGSVLTYNLGYTRGSSKSFERTVSTTFSDDDMGDYFVVRVTEDPVFGTPIFTTMGGKSKCPGETGTQRRESRVSISNIIDQCCSPTNPSCVCRNLPSGATANFVLVVNNLSPSWDSVYYTVEASNKFDEFTRVNPSGCGTAGNRGGLGISFSETDLQRIPYNKQVGVPFQVTQGLCDSYEDIEVRIIATCEMPSPNSYVIQYGIVDNKVSYERDNILFASNSTMTFSVSWQSSV